MLTTIMGWNVNTCLKSQASYTFPNFGQLPESFSTGHRMTSLGRCFSRILLRIHQFAMESKAHLVP